MKRFTAIYVFPHVSPSPLYWKLQSQKCIFFRLPSDCGLRASDNARPNINIPTDKYYKLIATRPERAVLERYDGTLTISASIAVTCTTLEAIHDIRKFFLQ